MTATTTTPTMSGVRLSFPRLVRSEWIKLRSIRSTIWCYAILVVITIALAVLLGSVVDAPPQGGGQDQVNSLFVSFATASVTFTALVVGVLGVLIITGEYGTGQIRSTFTADPGRTGAVLAKALVLALTTFLVSAVSTWIGVVAAAALQAGNGIHPDVADPAVVLPILGSSVYVTLVALLAFGFGLLVKSSAGGIAITLGILLVLPIIVQLLAALTGAQWVADLSQFLPSQAGGQLYSPATTQQPGTGLQLDGWGGFAVLAAEVLVVGGIALAAARTRDV